MRERERKHANNLINRIKFKLTKEEKWTWIKKENNDGWILEKGSADPVNPWNLFPVIITYLDNYVKMVYSR